MKGVDYSEQGMQGYWYNTITIQSTSKGNESEIPIRYDVPMKNVL